MAECCHHKNQVPTPAHHFVGRYTCPMHPDVVQDMPGDCPFCGMPLEALGLPKVGDDTELRDLTRKLVESAILTLPVFILGMAHLLHGSALANWAVSDIGRWLQAALATVVVFWCGWPFQCRAWASLRHHSANMFTLITAGTLAAWGFSMAVMLAPKWIGSANLYFEAAAVIITLVLAGQVMEQRARQRTGQALRALMDLAPATAWKTAPDGTFIEVALEEIHSGDIVRVRPGGKVPVDGIVVSGTSTVDESLLTGESLPVPVQVGSKAHAGTINGAGSFDLHAEGVGAATLLAQIIALVAEAQRGRAPVQDLADRVAAVFVPVVFAVAVLAFLAWIFFAGSLPMAITAAVSVLIIACPCAIGLAVPMSIMVGVVRAARSGILVRQPAALERLAKIDTVCLDKTGTLTEGRPEVTRILCAQGITEAQVLRIARALEEHSEHPLAAAIVRRATEQGVAAVSAVDFQSTPGGGVSGKVDSKEVKVGTPGFAGTERANISSELAASRIDVAEAGRWLGTFLLADAIKPSARESLDRLSQRGLHIVMLTGDNQEVAADISAKLRITDFRAGLAPGDKAKVITAMQAKGRRVCMAGDGVNDAPALALADTSIAMGAGSDVAKETADFILVHGSLEGIARTFELGHAIMRNVRENLFLAFAYNALGIPLAAGVLYPFTGWLLSPMIAGAAMSLSSVSVIANALRLGRAT
ncbi:MAG: copper-translocating P-type ATPase [Verrucomicrobia bacterium]|nr:copper-translocating P-type ATPase [Verrucomicrobiota bacterium]